MTKIDTMFASLIIQFIKSLFSQGIDCGDLKLFLSEDLVLQRSNETSLRYLPLLHSNLMKDISTIKDLMLLLNSYWSFFNYSLLEKLIKRFGGQKIKDDILKNYVTQLQELSMSEIPVILHHLPRVEGFCKDHLIVTMAPEFFTSPSVDDLLLIHDGVARVLRIERFGLLLRHINTVKHQVNFLIANTSKENLLEFSQLDMSSLKEIKIVSIEFQGTVRNQEVTHIDESDDEEGKNYFKNQIISIFVNYSI